MQQLISTVGDTSLKYFDLHSASEGFQKAKTFAPFFGLVSQCTQIEVSMLLSMKMECGYLNGWIKK